MITADTTGGTHRGKKNLCFFLYQCFYLHWFIDLLSLVCKIFFLSLLKIFFLSKWTKNCKPVEKKISIESLEDYATSDVAILNLHSFFSLGPALRPDGVMALMCVSVCLCICVYVSVPLYPYFRFTHKSYSPIIKIYT